MRYYSYLMPSLLPHQDQKLVQIVDAALASAERRSGDWLICKPGCTPCCIGVFAIDQLDALRLQRGHDRVGGHRSPACRASTRRGRGNRWRGSDPSSPATCRPACSATTTKRPRASKNSPTSSLALHSIPNAEPATSTSGVPLRAACSDRRCGRTAVSGVCELCYHGASPDEIESCEMNLDEANPLQAELVGELEKSGNAGRTIVAFALAGQRRSVVSDQQALRPLQLDRAKTSPYH